MVRFRAMCLVKTILQIIHILGTLSLRQKWLSLGSSGLGRLIPHVIYNEDTNKEIVKFRLLDLFEKKQFNKLNNLHLSQGDAVLCFKE